MRVSGPAAPAHGAPGALKRYRQAVESLGAAGVSAEVRGAVQEMFALLETTAALAAGLRETGPLHEALGAVLDVLRAPSGCLWTADADGAWHLRARRNVRAELPETLALAAPLAGGLLPNAAPLASWGMAAAYGIERAGKAVALLGLGPREGGEPYGPDEIEFLQTLGACAAAPLEGALAAGELSRVNERLSASVFQLRNVLEVSRELVASLDEDEIHNLLTATLMGHLMVSRCALLLAGGEGLRCVHERGAQGGGRTFTPEEAGPVLAALSVPTSVESLPPGPVREDLLRRRLSLVVPLLAGQRARGFVALGERASLRPFGEEDREFAQTLAGQAQSALESIHLHRVRAAKQRQDRELQIAREIQQSLFPRHWPALPGFQVAATSVACHEVGGDHYDVIALPAGGVALAVADVSGKGTPASLLMASVHASLRALAGTASPAALAARLNRFLFESTQANKYVTLAYAELDPATRRLRYVNAGHVPPCLLRADGGAERLTNGGPVLGLLEDVSYQEGEVELRPGDVLAMVTDGATEALSPDERELGEEGVLSALRACRGRGADETLRGLLSAVHEWTGAAGCTDDLTVMVLEAQ